MKKIAKVLSVVLAIAMIATLFAACSGSSNQVKVIDINLTD